MAEPASRSYKKGLYAALAGTVPVALCCFTPLLVMLLGTVGLSAVTAYLDWVLLPALAIMVGLSIAACLRWRRSVILPGSHRPQSRFSFLKSG